MDIDLKDFELAQERLRPILHHTELDLSSTFSAMTGGTIYLKCENRQKTGSFKIRGASNKIAAMTERGERCPVVASSAGNHAQGVAYAAKKFGIPATIVMPKAAPIAKAQATEGYGANNSAVEKISNNVTKLLIFVDCGATANEPLELAHKLGVDVIILDHHKTTDDLPICAAHVNPNRLDETEIDDQLHHICACGVVFLTLISCTKLLKERGKEAPDLIKFVPLVAFATICDVMALTPLNRAFVRTGIEFLDKNKLNIICIYCDENST